MPFLRFFSFCTLQLFVNLLSFGQENAAPSIHLVHYFPSGDAVLKMQKVKILQSVNTSYFEVNSFTNGYTGLQQTPDQSFGKPNILISSLWDADTKAGIYSTVEYKDSTTFSSRFGGEGDGWKTINPYDWKINTWYNIVCRAWKANNKLYIATFIFNESTKEWFHTASLSIPFPNKFLAAYNDAFLENWDGYNVSWNGSFIRKVLLKDCWNINPNGNWEKSTSRVFSANNSAADSIRNGIYHNSFNSYYDNVENAYCMQHGGNTVPSVAFNNGRTLNLPPQSNLGAAPLVSTAQIDTVYAQYESDSIDVSWIIKKDQSPQLSVKIELLNASNTVVLSFSDTIPNRRKLSIHYPSSKNNLSIRISYIDIFNQTSSTKFTPVIEKSISSIFQNPCDNYSNLYTIDLTQNVLSISGHYINEFRLYNLSGNCILHKKINSKEMVADLHNLNSGVYFIQLLDGVKNTYYRKLNKH